MELWLGFECQLTWYVYSAHREDMYAVLYICALFKQSYPDKPATKYILGKMEVMLRNY